MIWPWLKGLRSFHEAPLTYTILAINIFIFLMTMEHAAWRGGDYFSNKDSLILTGRLYAQFESQKGEPVRIGLQNGASSNLTDSQLLILGSQSLKSARFIEQAVNYNFTGDEIAINKWKSELAKFKESFAVRINSTFGLSSSNPQPAQWLTYQYMHASSLHLFSNMIFFMLFGAAIEIAFGSLLLIILYTSAGLAGAAFFLMLGKDTLAPMVGASGALTGLISFYLVTEIKKRIPYYYFLSPFNGFHGFIHLPTWFIFPLFILADLTAVISGFTEYKVNSGSVAYSAHVGGMICGLVFGLGYLVHNLRRKTASHRVFSNSSWFHKLF
jgi:membrane associated rhomboid family serine protease